MIGAVANFLPVRRLYRSKPIALLPNNAILPGRVNSGTLPSLSAMNHLWKPRNMTETRNTRIRRLVYQSSYTGMKETDLLLGRFAQDHLAGLSDEELDHYEALLEAGDGQIYLWVSGTEPVPAQHDTSVLELIKKFRND
jgi:antitoxin CptB